MRYAETDQMGVAHHSSYFVWLEAARIEHCRALGFDYRDLEREEGAFLAVIEAYCRYRAPARFDDVLEIEASVMESRTRTIRFGYELRRCPNGELLATAETLHAVTNSAGRYMRLPDRYREFFPRS